MKQFTFDVKLWSSVAINAATIDEARDCLTVILDSMCPNEHFIRGFNDASDSVTIDSVSLEPEEGDEPDRIEPEEVTP